MCLSFKKGKLRQGRAYIQRVEFLDLWSSIISLGESDSFFLNRNLIYLGIFFNLTGESKIIYLGSLNLLTIDLLFKITHRKISYLVYLKKNKLR